MHPWLRVRGAKLRLNIWSRSFSCLVIMSARTAHSERLGEEDRRFSMSKALGNTKAYRTHQTVRMKWTITTACKSTRARCHAKRKLNRAPDGECTQNASEQAAEFGPFDSLIDQWGIFQKEPTFRGTLGRVILASIVDLFTFPPTDWMFRALTPRVFLVELDRVEPWEPQLVPRPSDEEWLNMAVSDRDKSVLESIFNPLLPLGGDVPQQEVSRDAEDMSESTQLAKEYETSGVHKAEAGLFDEAMELFDKAISATPMRASCYNNRAQLFRLKGKASIVASSKYSAILF